MGPVSGAHFNPAVSLVFFARGELTAGLLVLYVLVQCAGGIAGTILAHAMFDMELLVWAQRAYRRRPMWLKAWHSGLLPFWAVCHRPEAVPVLVGLYMAVWFTASTSFPTLP